MQFELIVARALHFWFVALLFGGGGFNSLVGIGRIPMGTFVLRLSACAAALTGIAWFALTFVNVTGSALDLLNPQDWSAFAMSPFGPPWIAQLALDATTLALFAVGRSYGFVIVGALLVFDQAWLGHAAIGTGILGGTMVATYAIHVLAGFGWIGALTMLCFGLRSSEMRRDGLSLFSNIGVVVVAAIVASGCLNAAFHMSDLWDLWTSVYGRLVLFKAALLALMLIPAAFNRRAGRLDTTSTRRIALSVGFETALGILTLCAAAALGVTAPAT